ncbi:MAG: DUF2071 domain-containing protein [Phycisphaerales bacterium]|nr:DUF2071 domain-containing protein [Phycisphaerales bacterium]
MTHVPTLGPSPRPPGRPVMTMHWRELLFVHWPVPVEILRPLVPERLEIDTHDGTAWIGLVPFTMRDVRHRRCPPVPTMHRFHECNVRTYVRCGDEPAVWFFSLDAESRLAVWGARRFWGLNYVHSTMTLERSGDEVTYTVSRVRTPSVGLRCRWRTATSRPPATPGGLDHFLTERYALVTIDRRGSVRIGRIWHEPWRLRQAELVELDDGLVAAAGVDLDGRDPALVFAGDSVDVSAWGLERG